MRSISPCINNIIKTVLHAIKTYHSQFPLYLLHSIIHVVTTLFEYFSPLFCPAKLSSSWLRLAFSRLLSLPPAISPSVFPSSFSYFSLFACLCPGILAICPSHLILCAFIGYIFKFGVKIGVEESIVNAPPDYKSDQLFKSKLSFCVVFIFNLQFEKLVFLRRLVHSR
jgi:hypothetical protein